MANLNKVLLMGNLTRDPELRYTPRQTAVADLGLAINRIRGGGDGGERTEETTYIDVTLWGRQAEIANQYLKKGQGVFIEGRLQLDTWEDKTTGQRRSKLKVVGENMQFLGGPRGGGGGQSRPSSPAEDSPSRSDTGQQSSPSGGGGGGSFDSEEDDDIPF
ncbi:MAG: single-stranded DNA-binding protein [Verrucomicrobiota bacterium JB023]|nr:single-stranded DNA-binding protein [Verrucomicrobiota bacterium JB023]